MDGLGVVLLLPLLPRREAEKRSTNRPQRSGQQTGPGCPLQRLVGILAFLLRKFIQMRLLLLAILWGPSFAARAQSADTLYEAGQVPDFAQRNRDLLQQVRSYAPGRNNAFYGYPLADRTRNVSGVVLVTLVVGADGRPRDVRPLTRLGNGCTDTAVALVHRLPWQAGQLGGQPVAVRYTMPVRFAPPAWRANGHPTQAEISAGNAFITQLAAPYPAEAGLTEPRFPGGVTSAHIDAYFTSTVRAAGGQYASATGQPVVRFVVEADGRVTHPQVLASVCPPCDSSVLAAVRRMPAWTPARRHSRPVARAVRVMVNYQAVASDPTGARYLLPPPTAPAADTAALLPAYPGGDAAMLALVRRTYPVRTDPGAASLVLAVAGVVLPDGRFTDLQLPPLVPASYRPQFAAVAAAMRPWQPGRTGGQPVPVRTVLLLPMPSSAEELRQLGAETQARAAAVSKPDKRVYDFVEQMPHLPGNQSVNLAVRKALHVPAGTSAGRAVVCFVVMPNGAVQQLQLLQSSTPALGQAVLAAVRQLPAFVPGRQNGRGVAVRFTVPVSIQ